MCPHEDRLVGTSSLFLCSFLVTIASFRPFAADFVDLSPVFVRSLLLAFVLSWLVYCVSLVCCYATDLRRSLIVKPTELTWLSARLASDSPRSSLDEQVSIIALEESVLLVEAQWRRRGKVAARRPRRLKMPGREGNLIATAPSAACSVPSHAAVHCCQCL